MMKISKEIEKTASDIAVHMERLSEEQAEEIKACMREKYIHSYRGGFLWENFKKPAIIQDAEGWKRLCDFVGDQKCLMFFDDFEDKSVLAFDDGEGLYRLLHEMYGFEFYITDFETGYLLCYNHHDCLLACGLAKDQLERKNQDKP